MIFVCESSDKVINHYQVWMLTQKLSELYFCFLFILSRVKQHWKITTDWNCTFKFVGICVFLIPGDVAIFGRNFWYPTTFLACGTISNNFNNNDGSWKKKTHPPTSIDIHVYCSYIHSSVVLEYCIYF